MMLSCKGRDGMDAGIRGFLDIGSEPVWADGEMG